MDDASKKESLKREMHRTSRDLVEKIDQLDGVLHDTFEEGKEFVDRAIDTVDLVARTLSPVRQIRKRPLTWVGGAVAGGFVAGRLALGPNGQRRLPTGSGRTLIHAFAEAFAPELKSLKEVLLISAAKYAADRLRDRSPEYRDQISQIEESLRSRLSQV